MELTINQIQFKVEVLIEIKLKYNLFEILLFW